MVYKFPVFTSDIT